MFEQGISTNTKSNLAILSNEKFIMLHIIKSIVYFNDAESENMPKMIKPVSWKQVKQFFISESLKINSGI